MLQKRIFNRAVDFRVRFWFPGLIAGIISTVGFVLTATGTMNELLGFSSVDNEIVFAGVCLMNAVLSFYSGIEVRFISNKS